MRENDRNQSTRPVQGRLVDFVKRDDGINFIEVAVTLIMVMAAVVLIMHSLYFGERMLDVNMHRQQVLRLVQEEVEYWVGRMYLSTEGNPSTQEVLPKYRYKSIPISDKADGTPTIIVWLSRSEIQQVDDIIHVNESGDPRIGYYRFTIWGEWEEPDGQAFLRNQGTEVGLTTFSAPIQ
ncbi:hypothetical protein KJ564_12405 [bacterium]|nr:hypothetical protein [bacterium]